VKVKGPFQATDTARA